MFRRVINVQSRSVLAGNRPNHANRQRKQWDEQTKEGTTYWESLSGDCGRATVFGNRTHLS